MDLDLYAETTPVPRAAKFPIELRPPEGFRPEDPATWPDVPGRLEYVGGKLLFMPPCGDTQQYVVTDIVYLLRRWTTNRADLVVGTNEAGMILGRDVRGADVGIWRRSETGPRTGGYQRVPPLLAVEVAGIDDDEAVLREKSTWYRGHGVKVVWIVLPDSREVIVIDEAGEARFAKGQRLAAQPDLPGLEPPVDDFFSQLD